LNEHLVEIARQVPGVDAAEGRSVWSAMLVDSDGEEIMIGFTAIEDPRTLTVNLLKPAEGETELPSLGKRQILFDSSAASLGYQPGDTVAIERMDGKHRQLTLAGYVHDITAFQYMGRPSDSIPSYVTPETMEWLGGPGSFNSLLVSVAEHQTDQAHVTEVAQAVDARLEKAGATVYTDFIYQPGHHYTWTMVQGIFFLIGALSYMVVFLSAFLIINTVVALMAQQTRQIGIMKTVGGGTPQILGMYVILIAPGLAVGIAIPLATGRGIFGKGMAEYPNFFTLPYTPIHKP
jgi:putative ABC transport system permease protein